MFDLKILHSIRDECARFPQGHGKGRVHRCFIYKLYVLMRKSHLGNLPMEPSVAANAIGLFHIRELVRSLVRPRSENANVEFCEQ